MAIQGFQFLTSNGQTLNLLGEALSYTDEIGTGVVEHQILKRNGALHQLAGTPPKKFVFQCCMRGADVQARYQRLVYAIVLLGLLHFFWMRAGKNDFADVWIYATIIVTLLAWRVMRKLKPNQQAK